MHKLFLLLLTTFACADSANRDQPLHNYLEDWRKILAEASSQLDNNPGDIFLITCVAVAQQHIADLNATIARGE